MKQIAKVPWGHCYRESTVNCFVAAAVIPKQFINAVWFFFWSAPFIQLRNPALFLGNTVFFNGDSKVFKESIKWPYQLEDDQSLITSSDLPTALWLNWKWGLRRQESDGLRRNTLSIRCFVNSDSFLANLKHLALSKYKFIEFSLIKSYHWA